VKILHAENVLARRYFYPGCHQMEPYRSNFPNAGLLLPETEKLIKRVISLPNGTAVSPEDIHIICQIIRFVIDNAIEIKVKLLDMNDN
jgi:dTDP-4-amino-4,6-dideoxygalactose transaminase